MSGHAQVSERPMSSKIPTEIREYGGLTYRKPESFMDLPLEVKDIIYNILLQIDTVGCCHCFHFCYCYGRRSGCCTTILRLSRNIRAEAVRVFERLTPNSKFVGHGECIARNWHDRPTPPISELFLKDPLFRMPRRLPELALLRLRKIVVDFRYPAEVEDDDGSEVSPYRALPRMSGLRIELRDLQEVVLKSKSLVEVHFRVQINTYLSKIQTDDRSEPAQYIVELSKDYSGLFALFHPLLYAARSQTFRITAKENEDFVVSRMAGFLRSNPPCNLHFIRPIDYHDPLVEYINDAAQMGLGASPPQEELPFPVLGEADGEEGCGHHPSPATTKTSDCITYPHVNYELTPECRKCYETFREKEDLKLHLRQNPDHKMPFTKRGSEDFPDWWSKTELSKQVFCQVCGKAFLDGMELREHCKNSKHFRTREQLRVLCRVCGKSYRDDVKLYEHCRNSKHFRTREQPRVGKRKQGVGVAGDSHKRQTRLEGGLIQAETAQGW